MSASIPTSDSLVRFAMSVGDIDEHGEWTDRGRRRLTLARRKLADDTAEKARAAWRTAMRSRADDHAHIAVVWCIRAAVAARRASLTDRAARLDAATRRLLESFPVVAKELDDIASLPREQRMQAFDARDRRLGLDDNR